jgi:predicted aldo/keto reductase-like oxidoreductase
VLYREIGKCGDKVSVLGYGCMRFPKKNLGIDEARTEKQIISAIERGVNYFDTAYLYNAGKSESVLGNTLAKGYRNKVLVATKIPTPLVNSVKDMETALDTQLRRLKTDRIDCYLMHSIVTKGGWQRLKDSGVANFLEKAKKDGKIRRAGFSYHGDRFQFNDIIDDYPWDFCQIQYNYLDEHFQARVEGLRYAAAKGLGVIVMEPLRGGLLVREMPPEINAIWEKAVIKRTPAEWALRWIWNHPEVSVVLSGMNEESHIDENIRIAENALPNSLSAGELELIEEVRSALSGILKIGCTGCGYCMPCPAGVNIPACFNCYNSRHLFRDRSGSKVSGAAPNVPIVAYMMSTGGMDSGQPSYASLCRNCGQCESRCPQGLPIRDNLRAVAREMERFYFRPMVYTMKGYYGIMGRLKRGKSRSS